MTIRTLRFYLALSFLMSATLLGQTKAVVKDTIWLDTELSLGMPRDKVMGVLTRNYNLVKIADQDAWMIRSKSEAGALDYGEVVFNQDKLILIEKEWTPDDLSASSFALALYGALEQFRKEGRQMCSFDTQTFRSPTMESRTTTLLCGAKRLQIDATEIFSGKNKGKSVSIQELLMNDDAK